jgi:phosphatidate cytidylyltransferase
MTTPTEGHTTSRDAADGSRRDLRAAAVVGVGLVVALAAALIGPAWLLTLLIILLLLVASVELARLLAAIGRPLQQDVLVAAAIGVPVATSFAGFTGLAVGLVVLFVVAALRALADGARADVVGRLGRTVLFGVWLTGLGAFAVLLRLLDRGVLLLALVVVAAASGDIGAYLIGSRIGRRRIAPSVSPNKSWEGLAGGLLVAGLATGSLLVWLVPGTSIAVAGLFGVLVALAGFFGDLIESMVKRDLGVKDLGRSLPGHGGVLDRVDGVLLALPVGYGLAVVLL